MPTFEQRPPRIEAILYDGTNDAAVASLVGGSLDEDGNLLIPLYGPESEMGTIPAQTYVWVAYGEVVRSDPESFLSRWRAV